MVIFIHDHHQPCQCRWGGPGSFNIMSISYSYSLDMATNCDMNLVPVKCCLHVPDRIRQVSKPAQVTMTITAISLTTWLGLAWLIWCRLYHLVLGIILQDRQHQPGLWQCHPAGLSSSMLYHMSSNSIYTQFYLAHPANTSFDHVNDHPRVYTESQLLIPWHHYYTGMRYIIIVG